MRGAATNPLKNRLAKQPQLRLPPIRPRSHGDREVTEQGHAPKTPQITVRLTEQNDNVFAILGRFRDAARRAGLPEDEIERFVEEATSGDYNHLLQVAMRWFELR